MIRKRILVVGLSNNIGGIETFFHSYYRLFDKKEYVFDFVTVCPDVAFGDEYRKNGSNVFIVPHFLRHPIKYYNILRSIIRNNKYDVVHINMLSAANILPIQAALKEKNKNVIVHSHSADVPSGILRRILHAINLNSLRRSNTTKISCGQKAGEWLFGGESKFEIIDNAISEDMFKFNKNYRKIIREKYGVKPSEFLLGSVGRLCEVKNHLFLIKILSEIKSNDRIKLMIVGSGEDRELIEKTARESGIIDRLIIVENTPEIEKYYSAFDLFLFPSIFEGMPIAPVEAQANGLKCLISANVTREVDQGNSSFLELEEKKWIDAVLAEMQSNSLKDRSAVINDRYRIRNQYKKLAILYDKEANI